MYKNVKYVNVLTIYYFRDNGSDLLPVRSDAGGDYGPVLAVDYFLSARFIIGITAIRIIRIALYIRFVLHWPIPIATGSPRRRPSVRFPARVSARLQRFVVVIRAVSSTRSVTVVNLRPRNRLGGLVVMVTTRRGITFGSTVAVYLGVGGRFGRRRVVVVSGVVRTVVEGPLRRPIVAVAAWTVVGTRSSIVIIRVRYERSVLRRMRAVVFNRIG